MTQCLVFQTETGSLTVPDIDPLEQMLIEHPSMSVYQMRCVMNEDEDDDEEEGPQNSDEGISRLLDRHVIFFKCMVMLVMLKLL